MTDIVERLRASDRGNLEWEAADKIERLRAENKALREEIDSLAYLEPGWPDALKDTKP